MSEQDADPKAWFPSFLGAMVLFLVLYGLALYVGHTLAS